MTATETSLDLGQIAVVAEAHAPMAGSMTVDVTSIDELAPEAGVAGWTIENEGGTVVFAPIGTPDPAFVQGLLSHIGDQLGLPVVETAGPSMPAPTAASAVGMRSDDGSGIAAYLVSAASMPQPAPEPDLASTPNGLITLGMLREVPLEVSAELGRARMSVSEILQLNVGSVVELDRTAGSPVDVVVNGSLIARGEVVVIDDEYGVRITEILGRVSDSL